MVGLVFDTSIVVYCVHLREVGRAGDRCLHGVHSNIPGRSPGHTRSFIILSAQWIFKAFQFGLSRILTAQWNMEQLIYNYLK